MLDKVAYEIVHSSLHVSAQKDQPHEGQQESAEKITDIVVCVACCSKHVLDYTPGQ